MIYIEEIKVDDGKVLGLKVDLPNSPPLLLIIGERGFIMCGFLNVDVAEKLGIAAAMVSGVENFNDVLDSEIKAITSKARGLGLEVGMRGEEALKKLV